jgi:hypothetical protein
LDPAPEIQEEKAMSEASDYHGTFKYGCPRCGAVVLITTDSMPIDYHPFLRGGCPVCCHGVCSRIEKIDQKLPEPPAPEGLERMELVALVTPQVARMIRNSQLTSFSMGGICEKDEP